MANHTNGQSESSGPNHSIESLLREREELHAKVMRIEQAVTMLVDAANEYVEAIKLVRAGLNESSDDLTERAERADAAEGRLEHILNLARQHGLLKSSGNSGSDA